MRKQKESWEKLITRENVDITTISGIDVVFYRHIQRQLGIHTEALFTFCDQRNITHYTCADFEELGRTLYRHSFAMPKQIRQYYQRGKSIWRTTGRAARRADQFLKKDSSSTTLLRNYTVFRKLFDTINDLYSITSWVALESWQKDFDTSLQELITKRGLEERRDDIIMNVSKPWKTTALHEIQWRLQNGESPEKLRQRYQFLRSWVTVWHRPLDAAWIRQFKKRQKTTESHLTFKKLCELLQPDAKMKKFLIAAPFMAFFKDWRDDLRRYHAFVWSPLFESIEKHFGLKPQESGYLSFDEIQTALEKDACDRSRILLRRNKPCVVTVDPKTLMAKVIDGTIPQKYVRIQARAEKVQRTSITGRTGNPGKVRGKVFLLRTFHDIKRIPKGRVLVASTTHPNYVPAMRKSIAIVTDEGGIISHAAIIARELHKPCVVGTKNATSTLQDGDRVEVDAEKGIVRKV